LSTIERCRPLSGICTTQTITDSIYREQPRYNEFNNKTKAKLKVQQNSNKTTKQQKQNNKRKLISYGILGLCAAIASASPIGQCSKDPSKCIEHVLLGENPAALQKCEDALVSCAASHSDGGCAAKKSCLGEFVSCTKGAGYNKTKVCGDGSDTEEICDGESETDYDFCNKVFDDGNSAGTFAVSTVLTVLTVAALV